MRFTFALLAFTGALATVSAVSTGSGLFKRQFPNCADACLTNADTGACPSGDDTCLCNNAAFVNSVTSCISSSCTGSDLTTADADARQLCEAVGVTLTASAPASTASASTASSASSAAPSSTAPSSSASVSASPSATHSSGAMSHSVNALAGLVAVGAVAFAL